jgi:hypothetical protein
MKGVVAMKRNNPHFPALRFGPTAVPGASRKKQIPSSWKEGMAFPGAAQVGLGKNLLEKYPWSKFEPHPEWAPGCFAAGIPGELVFVYLPKRNIYNWSGSEVKDLDPTIDWHAYYFDPATGRTFDQGSIKATATDKSAPGVTFKKNVPSPQDWVLVLERVKSGKEK